MAATSESMQTATTTTSGTVPKQIPSKAKETAVGFVVGGLAACGAVTFTNPTEVIIMIRLGDLIDPLK